MNALGHEGVISVADAVRILERIRRGTAVALMGPREHSTSYERREDELELAALDMALDALTRSGRFRDPPCTADLDMADRRGGAR